MKPPHPTDNPATLAYGDLAAIVRIVLLYALIASLWILLSDHAVGLLFADPASIQAAGTAKGLLFVAVTSVLLFFLVLRFAARQNGNGQARPIVDAGSTLPASSRRRLFVGIVLFSLVFVLLGGGAILQNTQRHRQLASEHLVSIARLKAMQIESWLEERRRDAQVVRTTPLLREMQQQRKLDSETLRRLQLRMDEFRTIMRYGGIAVIDSQGKALLQSGMHEHAITDHLRHAVKAAIAAEAIQFTDILRMEQPAPPHAHLDIVAPLPRGAGEHASDIAVVLRIDVAASLYPFLHTWPVPSETAETVLFRRAGEAVQPLSELRHGAQDGPLPRTPFTQSEMLAVQALDADYRPGTLIEGTDYRGVPALGVAHRIAATPWWLIAKVDRDEIFREADTDALWIAFSSILAWIVSLILAVLFYKQRELQHAQQQHREQAERLHALQLLDAVVGSSTDAIVAKDAQGRYLLFNNEAARLTAKTPAEVLGHDDRVLFPPEQAALIMANDRQVMSDGKTVTFQEKLDTTDGAVVFLATKGPLRNVQGAIFGVFGISRDITKLKHVEDALHRQTDELAARNAELERFNRVMVGRELDMIALKRHINDLARELGRAPPYPSQTLDTPSSESGP